MSVRVVIDTNIWIRILLRGRVTLIDGAAEIIVSGDNDLRADDALRAAMETYDIQLLGVQSFLNYINEASE